MEITSKAATTEFLSKIANREKISNKQLLWDENVDEIIKLKIFKRIKNFQSTMA